MSTRLAAFTLALLGPIHCMNPTRSGTLLVGGITGRGPISSSLGRTLRAVHTATAHNMVLAMRVSGPIVCYLPRQKTTFQSQEP